MINDNIFPYFNGKVNLEFEMVEQLRKNDDYQTMAGDINMSMVSNFLDKFRDPSNGFPNAKLILEVDGRKVVTFGIIPTYIDAPRTSIVDAPRTSIDGYSLKTDFGMEVVIRDVDVTPPMGGNNQEKCDEF